MNNKFLSGLLIAAAAVTGAFAQASTASAQFVWNNAWQQPQILSGSSVGFDAAPFQQFVPADGLAVANSGQRLVNPAQMFLRHNYDVKVSFINENAGYRNQLAFQSTGTTNATGLLFNDISCKQSVDPTCADPNNGSANTLRTGDTVKMGMIQAGSQLNFNLRANGLNRGNDAYIFGTQAAQNADGLQHVMAYTYGSKYLVMGFEDLYGSGGTQQGTFLEKSDRDFNDTVFVVDIGEKNVACLNSGRCSTATPEPAAAAGLVGLGLTAAVLKRRRRG
jgi:hypothetical protein